MATCCLEEGKYVGNKEPDWFADDCRISASTYVHNREAAGKRSYRAKIGRL
jgi:hypothetical protein